MLGKNHLLTGTAGWCAIGAPTLAVTGYDVTPATIAAGAVVCAGASMLPDMDHPQATVARTFGPVTEAMSRVIAKLAGGHRQGTHTILATLAVFLLLPLLFAVTPGPWVMFAVITFCSGLMVRTVTEARGIECLALSVLVGAGMTALEPNTGWVVVAVTLGYAFHIIGDMLTPDGAPLLLPLSKTRFKLPVIGTTGDGREKVIASVAGLWAVYTLVTAVFVPVFNDHKQPERATANQAVTHTVKHTASATKLNKVAAGTQAKTVRARVHTDKPLKKLTIGVENTVDDVKTWVGDTRQKMHKSANASAQRVGGLE